MEHTVAGQKAAQRQRLRSQRRRYGPRRDGEALAAVLGEVFATYGIMTGDAVAGFLPTPHEPGVLAFLTAWCDTGPVVMPRTLADGAMEWIPWTPLTPLLADRHGLQAPAGGADAATVPRVRAMLVPALALDPAGHRLGQGGGYYDRALRNLPRWPAGPLRIGVVHPEGLLDHALPHAPHDQTVDVGACADRWRAAPGSAL